MTSESTHDYFPLSASTYCTMAANINMSHNDNGIVEGWSHAYDNRVAVRNTSLGSFGTLINLAALILIQAKADMKVAARLKISSLIATDLAIAVTTALYGITGLVNSSLSTCWFVTFSFVLLDMASHSTVTVISVLNCIAVVYPVYFRVSMTPARVALVLVGMWTAVLVLTMLCVGFSIPGVGRCLPLGLLPTHGLLLFLSCIGVCDVLTIAFTLTICCKLRTRYRATTTDVRQHNKCLPVCFEMKANIVGTWNIKPGTSQIMSVELQTSIKHQQESQEMTREECLLLEEITNNVCIASTSTPNLRQSNDTPSTFSTGNIQNSGNVSLSSKVAPEGHKNIDETYTISDELRRNISRTNIQEPSSWAVKTGDRSPDSKSWGNHLLLSGISLETGEEHSGSSQYVTTPEYHRQPAAHQKYINNKCNDAEENRLPRAVFVCKNKVANVEVTGHTAGEPLKSDKGDKLEASCFGNASTKKHAMVPAQKSVSSKVNDMSLTSTGIYTKYGLDKTVPSSSMCLIASDVQPHHRSPQGHLAELTDTHIFSDRDSHENRQCPVNVTTIISDSRSLLARNHSLGLTTNSSFAIPPNKHHGGGDTREAPMSTPVSPAAIHITNNSHSSVQESVKTKSSSTSRRVVKTITLMTMWSGILHFVSLLILLWMVLFEEDKNAFLVSAPGLVSSTLILFNALTNPVIYVWNLTRWKTLCGTVKRVCTRRRR